MNEAKGRIGYGLGLLLLGFVMAWIMLSVNRIVQSRTPDDPTFPNGRVAEIDIRNVRPSSIHLGQVGAENAIAVFNDYECPYCLRHRLTLEYIIQKDSTVQVSYYHFPNDELHPGANRKARFVECVSASHGDVLGAHDAMFEPAAFSDITFATLAERFGDPSKIMNCLNGMGEEAKRVDEILATDMEFASANGLRGTPTSIVNGKLIPGASPVEVILEALR